MMGIYLNTFLAGEREIWTFFFQKFQHPEVFQVEEWYDVYVELT